MDFKKLISHIESIDGAIETPKAPTLADPIRLDEGTELRVLAGVTALTESVIAEKAVSKSQQKAAGAALAAKRGEGKAVGASKEMMKMSTKELEKFAGTKHKGLPEKKDESVEEGFDADAKVGDKKKTQHGVLTKTEKGVRHERSYTKEKDEDDDEPKAKKAKKESVDPEAFKAKFTKMVEAKKEEKPKAKKDKKMDEAAKPDFLDVDKDGDKKEPMKKAAAEKGGDKKDGKKGMSDKQAKYFGKKNESTQPSKKVVAESVEQKLTFKDMMKLVVESGGQQQIDPVDTALFNWATRVAKQKLGEGMKAEVYAGMVYERMGGRFEMYDVLSEEKK
jgi:hypothetical protein